MIEGADILSNDRGTAPGQWVEESGAVAMLLPGPPHELKAMFERQCLPRLARIVPKQVIRTAVPARRRHGRDRDLDQLISPVYKKYENPVTTILAAAGDIQMHLRARCATEAEADALLAEVGGPIELLLGDRIYSRNGDPLRSGGGRAAAQEARHGLGGGELPPAGCWASASPPCRAVRIISSAASSPTPTRMKMELLGVPPEILKEHGAVSKETAEAMALGARRRTSSTYALSITGAAGPETGDEKVPKGTMYIGLADAAGTTTLHRQFLGDRQRVRTFAAQLALDLLRRRITGRP